MSFHAHFRSFLIALELMVVGTGLRAVRSYRDEVDHLTDIPGPIRQGARIRFDELELRVLKLDKACNKLEEEIIDDYDALLKAKSQFRGSLMDM